MRILNLYAGIGGNRKLWGEKHDITAIELDPEIAKTYKGFFPDDKVIIADAHQFLLDHFKEFEFIWASPPCPTHSRTNNFLKGKGIFRYPDMVLYQEIIFLKHFFKGKFCVENVISYYKPLIEPQKMGRHFLWANFRIGFIEQPKNSIGSMSGKNQTASKKPLVERNCVNSQLGLHVLRESEKELQ